MLKTLWIVSVLLFAGTANASVLFEPYGGYSVGNLSETAAGATTSTSGSINGFGYGGRVGFVFNHFAIVAGEYQGISAKEQLTGSTTPVNWTQSTYFGTLGFQVPMGLRVLASYGWDLEADESGATPTHYKGTAVKFGIGWHLMYHVAINAEYTIYTVTNYRQNTTTGPISDLYSKFNYSAGMVTLSFPFTFFHWGHGGGRNKSRGY